MGMKNLKTEIRLALVSEIQSLRQLVLWPHKNLNQCVLDSDHALNTFHVASFYQGQCVGTSTWQKESTEKWNCKEVFRLRAMAVHLDYRRQGIGEELIKFGIEHCKQKSIHGVWCDARMSALDFYKELQFIEKGEVYFVPQIGWHKFMYREFI